MALKYYTDIPRGISIIKKLNEAFLLHSFFDFKNLPEEILPRNMKRGSKEHLLYITFISAIAYRRKEEQLWEAAKLTYEDEARKYLFNPGEVLEKNYPKIESDMQKHGLLCNAHKLKEWSFTDLISHEKNIIREDDVNLWINLAKALSDYGSNIEELFRKFNYDALEILKIFTEDSYSNSFPEYRKKIKVIIWFARLERNANFTMYNLNHVPMVSGNHILRATFMTGGIWGELNSMQINLDDLVVEYWHKVAEEGKEILHISPLQFQIYLWVLSKFGCNPGKKDEVCSNRKKCPVKDFCVQGSFEIGGDYIHVNTKQFGSPI